MRCAESCEGNDDLATEIENISIYKPTFQRPCIEIEINSEMLFIRHFLSLLSLGVLRSIPSQSSPHKNALCLPKSFFKSLICFEKIVESRKAFWIPFKLLNFQGKSFRCANRGKKNETPSQQAVQKLFQIVLFFFKLEIMIFVESLGLLRVSF